MEKPKKYSFGARISFLFSSFAISLVDLVKRSIPYVGVSNNGNLGDEELFRIALRYIQAVLWNSNFLIRGRFLPLSLWGKKTYILGGGSLLFSKPILEQCERLSEYGLSPVLFGTGCIDLEEWEHVDSWRRILRASPFVGVRGVKSKDALKNIGIDAKVVGDLGFLVNFNLDKPKASGGYIVVNVRQIIKSGLKEIDEQIIKGLADLIIALTGEGYKIKLISVYKDVDDAIAFKMVRDFALKVELITYGGENGKEIIELLSNANLVIAMRLHPAIFAYALGVPVILTDTRLKYADAFSVFREPVPIIDAKNSAEDRLLPLSRQLYKEGFEERQTRFLQVRSLALSQLEVCKEVNRLVARIY